MKKYAYAAMSAATVALLATAATAAPVGHVEGSYSDVSDLDSNAWALGGGVVFPVGPVNVELDATGATTHVDGFGDEKSFSAAGHVFYRNDQYAAGAVVAALDEGLYAFGLEGAYYLDRVTLSAQIAQGRDESEGGVGNVGTAVGVGGKFFATDNFSLGANYINANPKGPGGSLDTWGVDGEYKFSAPVSVFAAYTRQDDFDVNAVTIGARWHFGVGSLKEQDRKGASMGGMSVLSSF